MTGRSGTDSVIATGLPELKQQLTIRFVSTRRTSLASSVNDRALPFAELDCACRVT